MNCLPHSGHSRVLPVDTLIVLRFDLSTAMRTCGVGRRPNFLLGRSCDGAASVRRSFVIGACCARAWRDLSVPFDETLGRTHKKSLDSVATFRMGFAYMNPAVEAQVNCLVCAMNAYCICQIADSNHLAILHYSASTPFFHLGTCCNAGMPARNGFFVPVTLEQFVPLLGSVIAAALFR